MDATSTDGATHTLARYFSTLSLEEVPPSIQWEAKRLILDTLGCLAAGARTELGVLSRRLAEALGRGDEATVAGAPGRHTMLAAAYANGRIANGMDFDETFPVGVHFGVGAVTAALAVGEARNLSGRDVLLAAITGYEVGARIAVAIGPMVLVENGKVVGYPDVWGVAAPVVMAAAGAKRFGLGPETTVHAYGLAGSNAPVPAGHKWAIAVDLPNCKYCDAGWCTHAGLFAALSAELGSTGFDTILDGDRGFLRMCAATRSADQALQKDLGKRWLVADITYKPWPSCRWTHYPLTAFCRLLEAENLQAQEIDEVVVRTSPLAASRRFTNPDPVGFVSRQYSHPHLLAMAALRVPVGPDWLSEEWARDPRTIAFKSKVRVELHPRAEDMARHFEHGQIRRMPGGVVIRTRGRTFSADADYALGDPWDEDTRFTDARLVAKFRDLVGMPTADGLIDAVFRLDTLPSITPLMVAFG